MFYATVLTAAVAVFSFAAAQNQTFANGPCCSVSPGSVPLATRQDWCKAEKNTCPQICGGIGKLKSGGGGNDCDPQTLNFTCICSDNSQPNVSDYQQSVPALMCGQWFSACINASGEDLEAQELCKSIKCGNKTISDAAASSSAPSSGASSTSGGGGSPSATSGSPSAASSKGAATALAIAREYGTPMLAAGMAAAFGLAL